MPTPAAMSRLADLRAELGRIDRLRVKLLGGEAALTMPEVVLLIDRARDGMTDTGMAGMGVGNLMAPPADSGIRD